MRHCSKAFTLTELLVTLSVIAIMATLAIPSFSGVMQRSRADTEVGDLVRALNYARLEAINRGVTVNVLPTTAVTGWTGELRVVASTDTTTVLRLVSPVSSGATLVAAGVTTINFNNLGGLVSSNSAVAMTYTLGSVTRVVNICLNGRIVQGGSCS